MKLELTGLTPLMMHNDRLVDPDDFYTKSIKVITDKRTNKTDEDRLEVARLEFAGGLYHHADTDGPYIPTANVKRCIQEAAKVTRNGKDVVRAFFPEGERVRLEYDGPRDIPSLWGVNGDSPFVDRRAVGVGAKKVMRVRPIFPNWSLSIEFELDDQVMDVDDFLRIASTAGRREGLGDFRPGKSGVYGQFNVEVVL